MTLKEPGLQIADGVVLGDGLLQMLDGGEVVCKRMQDLLLCLMSDCQARKRRGIDLPTRGVRGEDSLG